MKTCKQKYTLTHMHTGGGECGRHQQPDDARAEDRDRLTQPRVGVVGDGDGRLCIPEGGGGVGV